MGRDKPLAPCFGDIARVELDLKFAPCRSSVSRLRRIIVVTTYSLEASPYELVS